MYVITLIVTLLGFEFSSRDFNIEGPAFSLSNLDFHRGTSVLSCVIKLTKFQCFAKTVSHFFTRIGTIRAECCDQELRIEMNRIAT